MTKVYLVRSVRVMKGEATPFSVVENVFTNYKKALKYIEWLKQDYTKKEKRYWVVRYVVDAWNIDTCDYTNVPF